MDLKDQTSSGIGLIQSKIWKTLDVLHSEGVRVEDYYVALLFLSLAKHKFYDIKEVQTGKEFYGALEKKLSEIKTEEALKFLQMIPQFEEPIKVLSNRGLNQLISDSNGMNLWTKPEELFEIFDQMLYAIAKGQGRHGGEIIQPLELTRFLMGLADLPVNAKVFNPFAGLASFGVFLQENQSYYGQELNGKNWAIGQLRLMAYKREKLSRFIQEDSLEKWPDQKEKFDLIVSHPPFLPFSYSMTGRKSDNQTPRIKSYENFLIESSILSLKSNGKLIAILPQGFLFNHTSKSLRKRLIDEDLIDTIISLPGGILSNTTIPLIILIISTNKNHTNKTRFIDANNFVEIKNIKEMTLNDTKLLNIINSNYEESEFVRIVKRNQIEKNNFNLNVSRYFLKEIKGSKLGEILEVISKTSSKNLQSGRLIRIKDLKADRLDFNLDWESIEVSELWTRNINEISESCLLIASRWKTLKPTWFEYKGTPIYFHKEDIIALRVNQKLIDKAFLINELYSDYVLEQINAFRTGMTIPRVQWNDISEVVIKIPSRESMQSLEIQKAKVEGIFEQIQQTKALEKRNSKRAEEAEKTAYETYSSLEHSLGKPLLTIGSSLRNIEAVLNRINPDWEKTRLDEDYQITMKDTFNSVYENLKFIYSVIKNNNTVLDLSTRKLEDIDFLRFIKHYIKDLQINKSINFELNLDINPDINILYKDKLDIKANEDLLKIALDTIVDNAERHAFTENNIRYKLEFRVSLYFKNTSKDEIFQNDDIEFYRTYVKIEVSNNGKAFPENYSIQKFIRKNSFAGETGNTGQGGFVLNEIIKYHNSGLSTLSLITNDFASDFNTTFSFLIPLNS